MTSCMQARVTWATHIISFRGNFEHLEAVILTGLRRNRCNVLSLEPPVSSVLTVDVEDNTEVDEKRQGGLSLVETNILIPSLFLRVGDVLGILGKALEKQKQ